MGQAVTPEYDISEAVKAFSNNYAEPDYPIQADESLDVTTPLDDHRLLPVGRRQNAAITVGFSSSGDKCDVVMVLWGSDNDGAKVFLGDFRVENVEAISGKAVANTATFAETILFDTGAARFVEFRFITLSGEIDLVKAWTY